MSNQSDISGSVRRAIAEALAPKSTTNWNKEDPDITHDGKKIILPAEPDRMSTSAAIETLQRKLKDEETIMNVSETIDAFPLDGAVAMVRAMKNLYGWASPIPTMSFFGPIPPQMISVQVGPEDEGDAWVQVPWGKFTIPGIENPVQTSVLNTPTGPVFRVTGSVRKREQGILRELADEARRILKTSSIYKGKAIRLKANEDGVLDLNEAPTFLSTKYINRSELILNPDESDQVQANIWTPIQNTQAARNYGIPLKRGILLEGIYGIGKTLIATATSQVCVENGWTYILLDDVRAMKDALLFAKRYAPAVIFAEDAERIAGKRDQGGNDLLNTIDGVLSKNSEVMVIFTTNHVDRIERAMLRPGRLDAVISINAPESDAVQRLIKLYARGRLENGADLTDVSKELAGNIPATIREVTERAKLAMIGRNATTISARDLSISAKSMKRHLELLNVQPVVISDGDQLLTLLTRNLSSGGANGITKAVLDEKVEELEEAVGNSVEAMEREAGRLETIVQESSEEVGKKLQKLIKAFNLE